VSELKKLKKTIGKVERKFETASPIEKKRLLKKATSLQRKIDAMSRG